MQKFALSHMHEASSSTTARQTHVATDTFSDVLIFPQIPGFMVMQVRYLYEAEGNKKAKDAKAVMSKIITPTSFWLILHYCGQHYQSQGTKCQVIKVAT